MIRTALVAVCLFLTAACASHRGGGSGAKPPQPTDPAKITVFVSTPAPQTRVLTLDEVTRERATALIANALKGKKGLVLVTAATPADVTVSVLSAVSIFVPRTETKFDDEAIPVDVHAAGQTTRIVESGYDRTRTAEKVAKDIHRWIQANAPKILAARPPAR